MSEDPIETLIGRWLEERLPPDGCRWLDGRLAALERADSDRELHVTLGLVPRKLGRAELGLGAEELAAARRARDGWDPSGWTVETAARALALRRAAAARPERFGELFRDLCRTADLAESLALFAALPLLPYDEALDAQVGEGLRTNMRAVFEAIAHRNPYPRERFDVNRWNHMVLKALFVESPLAPVQGLDERANEELATILLDYARERRAAGRPVTPELWRCVGPFARDAAIDDLVHALDGGAPRQREAALLALAASPDPAAAAVLARHPDAAGRIAAGILTWDTLVADGAGERPPQESAP